MAIMDNEPKPKKNNKKMKLITNFEPKDEKLYKEAIARFKDSSGIDLSISSIAYNQSGEEIDDLMAVTAGDLISKHAVRKDFLKLIRKIRNEKNAVQRELCSV